MTDFKSTKKPVVEDNFGFLQSAPVHRKNSNQIPNVRRISTLKNVNLDSCAEQPSEHTNNKATSLLNAAPKPLGETQRTMTFNSATFSRSKSIETHSTALNFCSQRTLVPPIRNSEQSNRRSSVSSKPPMELQVVTWNIAAPNVNPFEYWATHEDPQVSSES